MALTAAPAGQTFACDVGADLGRDLYVYNGYTYNAVLTPTTTLSCAQTFARLAPGEYDFTITYANGETSTLAYQSTNTPATCFDSLTVALPSPSDPYSFSPPSTGNGNAYTADETEGAPQSYAFSDTADFGFTLSTSNPTACAGYGIGGATVATFSSASPYACSAGPAFSASVTSIAVTCSGLLRGQMTSQQPWRAAFSSTNADSASFQVLFNVEHCASSSPLRWSLRSQLTDTRAQRGRCRPARTRRRTGAGARPVSAGAMDSARSSCRRSTPALRASRRARCRAPTASTGTWCARSPSHRCL